MTNSFKTGDRVVLNQDYDFGRFSKGDTGEVTKVLSDKYSSNGQMVYVKLDNGKIIDGIYGGRLDKEAPTPKFKVGDRVQNKAGQFVYSKHIGKDLEVVKLLEAASDYDYTVGVVGDTVASHKDYTESELEAYVNPAPKTSGAYAEKSGFKFGDRVQVNRGNSFMTASAGKLGNVIEGGGSALIRVRLDGDTDYLAFYKSEISHYTEPKFNIGDYVQVTKYNSTFSGTKGWVVARPTFDTSGYIHINTKDKTGAAQWRFAPSQLIAAEEPFVSQFKAGDYAKIISKAYGDYTGKVFEVKEGEKAATNSLVQLNLIDPKDISHAWVGHFNPSALEKIEKPFVPKFKKGDWVEVTKEHNSVWAGVGQIETEATKGWSDVIVKLATGDRAGSTGGFAESKLIAATEPKPFSVGDYVEVVANPKSCLYYHAGKQGWVVEPKYKDSWIHVSLEGKGKKADYRFDPKDLQAAEEPKPFAIGERVQVDGYGSSGAYDHIIGVVIGFELSDWDDITLWVKIDASESNEGKFRRFPAENLKKLPKRELPKDAGKVIHVTKYDGDKVNLLAMCDGTSDTDPWFAPKAGDGDYWLDTDLIEQWTEAEVTVSL